MGRESFRPSERPRSASAVMESLSAYAAPAVVDRIVTRALASIGRTTIPEDPRALIALVRGSLRDEIARTLGDTAAAAFVASTLALLDVLHESASEKERMLETAPDTSARPVVLVVGPAARVATGLRQHLSDRFDIAWARASTDELASSPPPATIAIAVTEEQARASAPWLAETSARMAVLVLAPGGARHPWPPGITVVDDHDSSTLAMTIVRAITQRALMRG